MSVRRTGRKGSTGQRQRAALAARQVPVREFPGRGRGVEPVLPGQQVSELNPAPMMVRRKKGAG